MDLLQKLRDNLDMTLPDTTVETVSLATRLRTAILCLPLLGLAGCNKPESEARSSERAAPEATSRPLKENPTRPGLGVVSVNTSTKGIPSVAAKATTKCAATHNVVISAADADGLPHSGLTSLGCPSVIDIVAAPALKLVPDFGELRAIELNTDCTRAQQAIEPNACVYVANILYPREGRPAVQDGVVVLAPLQIGTFWRAAVATVQQPADVGSTTTKWLAIAQAEHASVASFARATLELLAVGAPLGLIRAAQEAAVDEVRHATLAFAIAAGTSSMPLDPGPMPLLEPRGGGLVEFAGGELCELVRTTFLEGCFAETSAVVRLEQALAQEEDTAIRAVLTTIIDDETRHAELAWQTVAWALRVGGAPVRQALQEAIRKVQPDSEPLRQDIAWTSVIAPSLALLEATL